MASEFTSAQDQDDREGRRERDQDDRRNVFVVRTNNGADFLEGFKRNLREGGSGQSAAQRPTIPRRSPAKKPIT